MTGGRRFAATSVALGSAALGHAALTWPPRAVVALFGGGALVAFAAEAVAVGRGWLDHHLGPTVAGVPPYVLFGWTGVVYVAFRVALLVSSGWAAVAGGAALATAYDALTDHRGVAAGYWTYTGGPPGRRHRGVPWWNVTGWAAVSSLTAALAVPFL